MLTVGRDGALLLHGKPYRGIGVNYFDAFQRHLLNEKDTSFEAGFDALAERGIPFIRFMACGFWPVEQTLYEVSPKAHFARLERFVKAAEARGIGLIPSLFWNMSTVPDLAGEPCSAWGDTKSRTHTRMHRYTQEVVTRFRDSKALWAWEFGNEYNLPADLPNAAEHRPQIAVDRGTPSTRTERDELTHDDIRTALKAFGNEVRRYDKQRLIVSGNALPRPSAWHQLHEKSWKQDDPGQQAEMLLADNPNPLGTLTIHAYEDFDRVADAQAVARQARKPLFLGEFGVPGAPTPESDKRFTAMLDGIKRLKIPLSALWVYDFPYQDDYTVTATNTRRGQLEAVAAANKRLRLP
ncbi:MAG: cellulase family glycosylhydrolase [Armatimonas sp.]